VLAQALSFASFRTQIGGERPKLSAMGLAGESRFYLHLEGVIDPAKERDRLQKKIAQIEKGIAGATSKLSNEKFIASAPEDLVAATKETLAGLERDKQDLADTMASLE
jgi:valyl-tRNA synthetase